VTSWETLRVTTRPKSDREIELDSRSSRHFAIDPAHVYRTHRVSAGGFEAFVTTFPSGHRTALTAPCAEHPRGVIWPRPVSRTVVNCRTRSQTAIPSATLLWLRRFVLRRVDDRLRAT